MELVSSSHETPEEMEIDVGAFGDFVAVSWGGLTSSKLQAPSYEEAVKCEPTTDHRLLSFQPYFPFNLFTYTIKTDMSAGETPEMREAWPRERGRTSPNFWRASMEMPSRWR